jgi:preprotein translocase subunit YajC
MDLFGLQGAEGGGAAGGIITFLPFVLIIAVFYFLIIRPQNKKQKETQKMLAALKKGDKVVTAGGIHGTVSNVKEKTVIVKVDDNTKLEFTRTSIVMVADVSKEQESSKDSKEESASERDSGEKTS